MTLISTNATQEVTLERFIGEDPEFHESTYEDPETILAVYEPASGTARTATGANVQVESHIQTATPIRLRDLIEGSEVKRVSPLIDFGGAVLWYDAWM